MTYDIPIGCDKITIEQVGNQIITEFIPKVEELKDLDCYIIPNKPNDNYLIFKDKSYVYLNKCAINSFILNKEEHVFTQWEVKNDWRKITRSEMQAELAKHGKYFDFKEKVLKNLRWRAKKNCKLYFIDAYFKTGLINDYRNDLSNRLFEIGNYHQTKEQCDEYAKEMIEYSKSLIK